MTEQHPTEDMLIDLALGDSAEPDHDALVEHLTGCASCRDTYDVAARTIDQSLPAAPVLQPRPGFDQTVLTALGITPDPEASAAPARRRGAHDGADGRVRRTGILVAAVILGVLIGAGSVAAWNQPWNGHGPDQPTASMPGAALTTADDEVVGMAAVSYVGDQRVVVVAAGGGIEGTSYECRLRLADGSAVTLGEWPVPDDGAMWVMPAPAAPAVSVELVADDGTVWSTATLDTDS
ncbi:anti-sigma factor [Phytoactinopolyspora limicola]|uniref:anti-sigma factor n=1 Tax=Phytoactinopolyspora limicola TaxID=2715536 RepID=UPI00140DEF95|nr:anti-sigma factor [Phytoactinopolyspora limicola]